MREPAPPFGRRAALLFLAAALALSFLAYHRSLQGELLFDDVPLLVESDCHRGLSRIPAMFDFGSGSICSIRPVRSLTFALDHALWGGWAGGYHLTNIVLHGVIAWLLLLAIWRVGRSRELAIAGALLFALHPIATEAVAYVSGRRDLMALLCGLLLLHVYLSYRERGGLWRLPLLAALQLAALFSHDSAVAYPPALLILQLGLGWPDRGRFLARARSASAALLRRRQLAPLAILLALAAGYAIWKITARNYSTRQELWGPDVAAHLATVLRVHARYLEQLLLPVDLVADYSPQAFPLSRSLWEPRALGALAVVAATLAGGIAAARRWPLVAAAVLCHFALLLPVSQIVIHHELLAEHRLYASSACYAALLAAGLLALGRLARRRWVGPCLVGAVALAFLPLTVGRTLDWLTPESLWSATADRVPRCARARANLGAIYARTRRFAAARRELETALAIRPDLCGARMNLGQLLLDTGDPERALAAMRRAVRCRPVPSAFLQLARAYLRSGRTGSALRTLRSAARRWPGNAQIRRALEEAQRSGP